MPRYLLADNANYFKQRYQAKINNKFGVGEYRLLGVFAGAKAQNKFKHKCGIKFIGNAQSLLFGYTKCPCQSGYNIKATLEYHRKIIAKRRPGFDCLAYFGNRDGISTYIHKKCGKTFKTTAASFLASKYCPYCAGRFGTKLRLIGKRRIQKRIDKLYPDEYTVLGKYKRIDRKIKIQHKCGLVYKAVPDSLVRQNSNKCPNCYVSTKGSAIKKIKIKSKTFKCQGYEPLTLKRLVKKYDYKYIKTGCSKHRLIINYNYNKNHHKYIPDFYIKSANLIVEVKSIATMGLQPKMYSSHFGKGIFKRNQAKARACIKRGFKFRLHLYDENQQRIHLPANWMFLPKSQVINQLGITR